MNNGKWMDLDWTLQLEMDGFRLDFTIGDGWIQTGVQSCRWMDLDWSLELQMDGFRLMLVKVTPGHNNQKQNQNQAASWKEGGAGEEGKRDLFFYIFSFREIG